MEIKNRPSVNIGRDLEVKKSSAGQAKGTDALGQSQGKNSNYNVSISPESEKVRSFRNKMFEAAKDSPAVREDKVKEFKDKIASGSYQVDSGKIADGMLREAIREKLAESSQ